MILTICISKINRINAVRKIKGLPKGSPNTISTIIKLIILIKTH